MVPLYAFREQRAKWARLRPPFDSGAHLVRPEYSENVPVSKGMSRNVAYYINLLVPEQSVMREARGWITEYWLRRMTKA